MVRLSVFSASILLCGCSLVTDFDREMTVAEDARTSADGGAPDATPADVGAPDATPADVGAPDATPADVGPEPPIDLPPPPAGDVGQRCRTTCDSYWDCLGREPAPCEVATSANGAWIRGQCVGDCVANDGRIDGNEAGGQVGAAQCVTLKARARMQGHCDFDVCDALCSSPDALRSCIDNDPDRCSRECVALSDQVLNCMGYTQGYAPDQYAQCDILAACEIRARQSEE